MLNTFTLQHAPIHSSIINQIQDFFIEYPHKAVDLRPNEVIENAIKKRNFFLLTNEAHEIRGVFASYLTNKYKKRDKIYIELGSNRLAPELQGYGLLEIQHFVRILSEVTRRVEKNESFQNIIFHSDTLNYLPQLAPKFRKLGFTEISRKDEQDYPHIRSLTEHKETVYFTLKPEQFQTYMSDFSHRLLAHIEQSSDKINGVNGYYLFLPHRRRNDSILIKLKLDILSNPLQFNRLQDYAKARLF